MKFRVAIFALLLSLPICARAADDTFVALEIELQPNRVDGCVACGCRVLGTLAPGEGQSFWLTFGQARISEDDAWAAERTETYCGQGDYDAVASQLRRTTGTPFLVVELRTGPVAERRGESSLPLIIRSRRLARFDERGMPDYQERTAQRALRVEGEETFTWTALAAEARVLGEFRVHEVLLRARVTLVDGDPEAAFGGISVHGDIPGASVWLDGGFAGLLDGDGRLELDIVATGKHRVTVRDFSQRESATDIRVRKGRVAGATLDLLGVDPRVTAEAVIAIGPNPQGHQEYWRALDRAVLVKIPAGPFLMGSPPEVGEPNERPQHEVFLPGFLIDKNEVSWRQYRQFAEDQDLRLPPAPLWGYADNFPASFVLLEEARQYCAWAGGRLPTEAEWEKAARGTDGRQYPWGDAWDPTRCNTIYGGLHQPEPSGSLPLCVSPYGVLDMVGNAQEWTAEPYRDYPGAAAEPQGRYASHVMRGGGWMTQPAWTRTAYRHRRGPDSRLMDHGFRCVRDIPEETP